MEVSYLAEKSELNNFIQNAADKRGAEFLQSWEWGELLKSEKEEILRFGVKEEGENLAIATIIKKNLGKGYVYWYSPRGAIFKSGLSIKKRSEVEDFLYHEIRKINPRAIFLRVEPKDKSDHSQDQSRISIRSYNYKKTLNLQPKQTLILDLSLSEEELLKAMHQKTRYNINLALKKGVEIKEGSAAEFSEFWRLMSLTGERDDFRIHGAEHYQVLLGGEGVENNNAHNFIKLFFAYYEGKNIAAGLFCFWGDKVTYMHGASDNEFRNVMAPYLLQWSVIKKAKEAGYKYYDFYGIDEKKWPGVTRFKLGFGGRIEDYSGTYDIVFSPLLYGLYGFLRKVRRFI